MHCMHAERERERDRQTDRSAFVAIVAYCEYGKWVHYITFTQHSGRTSESRARISSGRSTKSTKPSTRMRRLFEDVSFPRVEHSGTAFCNRTKVGYVVESNTSETSLTGAAQGSA